MDEARVGICSRVEVVDPGRRRTLALRHPPLVDAVRISWDPTKSEANLAERGFDFAFASLVFDGPTLEKEDRRRDYGERRIIAVGQAEGIHRAGGDGEVERRIISARQSNRQERNVYGQANPTT